MSTETTPVVEGIIIEDPTSEVQEPQKRNWKKPVIIGSLTLLGAAIVYRLASSSKTQEEEDQDEGWTPAPQFDETSTTNL